MTPEEIDWPSVESPDERELCPFCQVDADESHSEACALYVPLGVLEDGDVSA